MAGIERRFILGIRKGRIWKVYFYEMAGARAEDNRSASEMGVSRRLMYSQFLFLDLWMGNTEVTERSAPITSSRDTQ